MRDPVFQTWAEVEAWIGSATAYCKSDYWRSDEYWLTGECFTTTACEPCQQRTRVLAAHAHLKEQSDAD